MRNPARSGSAGSGPAGYGGGPARSRLFVALRLPPRVREEIARATDPVRALRGVRPVPAEHLHLTLRFIGEVERGLEAPVGREIAAAAAGLPGFDMPLRGVGAFPSRRRARVVWVGVEAVPGLVALRAGVEDAVVRAGVAPDPRPFRPHVTVGRMRGAPPPGGLPAVLARVCFEAAVRVCAVSLMRSKLLPGGARHTEVASCPLASPEA